MSNSYDTIVIGLGASGTTAASTLARAGKKVLGLDALDRVGGRINTVPFGDGVVELGAEWIHGTSPSSVYDLAIQNNVSVIPQDISMTVYQSDGSRADAVLVNELLNFALQVVDEPPEKPEPLGQYITRRLMDYIKEKHPSLLNDKDFITEFLAFADLMIDNYEATDSWNDITTESKYEELDGHQHMSWHRNGYKTLFEILLNTYKNGPGLPTLTIKLNTEVTQIVWPQEPTENVVVKTKDGGEYTADNVIVTVSVGVLKESSSMEQVPVFPVSCVRGSGLNALHAYLLALQPPHDTQSTDNESCEFQVDEIFHVGDSAGPVVGGLMARGQLLEGDNLIIGPFETGEFADISVRTIHRNRSRCGGVRAGQCASLGLSRALALRPGMVLLARPPPSARGGSAAFGACAGACKNKDEATDIVLSHQQDSLNKNNVRRKNKNLLQDIANVKSSLTKTIDNEQNIYKSDGEGKDKIEERSNSDVEKDKMKDFKQECVCRDVVLLEDPSNPRGCIFFQASVHILRHSTAICRGFQCTVHVGNVRQTAIIEGILSRNGEVRAGMAASLVFRFTRFPEFLVTGRRLLLTAGQGTRGIGRVTQVFPFVP